MNFTAYLFLQSHIKSFHLVSSPTILSSHYHVFAEKVFVFWKMMNYEQKDTRHYIPFH